MMPPSGMLRGVAGGSALGQPVEGGSDCDVSGVAPCQPPCLPAQAVEVVRVSCGLRF